MEVELFAVGQHQGAHEGHRLGGRPHVGQGVPLPRGALGLVDVAAPDVDDRLTVQVDGDRGSDIGARIEAGREGLAHAVESCLTGTVHICHVVVSLVVGSHRSLCNVGTTRRSVPAPSGLSGRGWPRPRPQPRPRLGRLRGRALTSWPLATTAAPLLTPGVRAMPIAITDDHQELASTVRGVLTAHKALQAARALLEADEEPRPPTGARWPSWAGSASTCPRSTAGPGRACPSWWSSSTSSAARWRRARSFPTVLASAVIEQCGSAEQKRAPAARAGRRHADRGARARHARTSLWSAGRCAATPGRRRWAGVRRTSPAARGRRRRDRSRPVRPG